jgi:hypothetical protein
MNLVLVKMWQNKQNTVSTGNYQMNKQRFARSSRQTTSEFDNKCRAFTDLTFHPQFAAVPLNNMPRDTQAQTAIAYAFGGEKRLKDSLSCRVGHSLAVVCYTHHGLLGRILCFDAKCIGSGLDGIHHQIKQYLIQFPKVRMDTHGFGNIHVEMDSLEL